MTIKIDALAQPTEPIVFQPDAPSAPCERTGSTDWQRRLPVLRGAGFHLRELRHSDAASLCLMLTTAEVSRFVTQPPTSVDGFEEFIEYAQRRRRLGEFVCFAVVPDGLDTAVGIFQLRALDPQFSTAEWGFALGSPLWGTGLFRKCAELVIAFAFDHVGTQTNAATARSASWVHKGKRCCATRWPRTDACTTSTSGRSSKPTGAGPAKDRERRFLASGTGPWDRAGCTRIAFGAPGPSRLGRPRRPFPFTISLLPLDVVYLRAPVRFRLTDQERAREETS